MPVGRAMDQAGLKLDGPPGLLRSWSARLSACLDGRQTMKVPGLALSHE